jgi:hypothetical protein
MQKEIYQLVRFKLDKGYMYELYEFIYLNGKLCSWRSDNTVYAYSKRAMLKKIARMALALTRPIIDSETFFKLLDD